MNKAVQTLLLSFLCLFSLSVGTAFFCMQSPSVKGNEYRITAKAFLVEAENPVLQKSAALYLLEEAVFYFNQARLLNPYSSDLDAQLQTIEQQKSNLTRDTDTAFLPQKQIIP